MERKIKGNRYKMKKVKFIYLFMICLLSEENGKELMNKLSKEVLLLLHTRNCPCPQALKKKSLLWRTY